MHFKISFSKIFEVEQRLARVGSFQCPLAILILKNWYGFWDEP
jgi:hypothetical protein